MCDAVATYEYLGRRCRRANKTTLGSDLSGQPRFSHMR